MNATFKTNVRRFHALLAKNKLMDQKENILNGQGVESTNSLTEAQLTGLIQWLDDKFNGRIQPDVPEMKDHAYALFDIGNRQHRYLLSLCQQLGWVIWDAKRNRYVADLQHLGHWIKIHSDSKKPIREQGVREMERTIYQFEQMVNKHFNPKTI